MNYVLIRKLLDECDYIELAVYFALFVFIKDGICKTDRNKIADWLNLKNPNYITECLRSLSRKGFIDMVNSGDNEIICRILKC
jgi:hypothetical protein